MTLPKFTRAARMHAPGSPSVLLFEEAPLPSLQPHEIFIAVEAAGINYPDLLLRSGKLPVKSLPHTLGFEAAGTVLAVGSAVRGVAVGQAVAAELPAGGGYAQHAIADAARVLPLDGGLKADQAMALLTAGRTALLMLRHARLARGETVFIPAAVGGVGSLAVRLAKNLGARVIAGVGSESRVPQAQALDADAVVVYDSEGWADDVREFTDGQGAEVVLQATGGLMGGESLMALAPRGRLVLYGADTVVDPEALSAGQVRSLIAQSQSFSGFGLMRVPEPARRAAFAELAQAVQSNALPLSLQHFPLAQAAEAHARMDARKLDGKGVLLP